MAEVRTRPASNRRKSAAAEPAVQHAGPAEIHDPVLRNEFKRAAVWIGLAAALALTAYLARPLLIIFGGMVFAAMIDGGSRLLGRVLKVERMWRVAIVLTLTIAFLVWTAMFAGSQIATQAAELPDVIQTQSLKVLDWLQAHGAVVNLKTAQSLIEKAAGAIGELTSAVSNLIGGLTTAFGIVVLGIYFALEPQLYQRGFAWLLPIAQREHFAVTARQMGHTLRHLMAGRLAGMTLEGIATWLLLGWWGVPMAALLGLLTGLLAFLPNIGAPISGAIMILVGFSDSTSTGLFCIFVYLFVHILDGNIVVPLIAKHTADLAPAVVLGMQLIMGTLFGLLGLMLADPLVAMIKVALERQSLRNEEA